ncbi:MAG: transposase [Anaerolineales bacterium]|nr:transposase [Anaerolineales bacterium]MCB0011598.1 transposase [Anaerolineales bacterium]
MGRYRVLEKHTPHFITSTIQKWEPVFMDPNIAQIMLDALAFVQQQKRLTLYAYVIMENHIHLVANAPELSREIGALKSFTARRILDCLQENKAPYLRRFRADGDKRRGRTINQLWQPGYHPQALFTDAMMAQKIDYIHHNPVRRGYVDEAWQWRYSSARDYDGTEGLIPVTTDWG